MSHLFAGNSYNTKKLLHSIYEELSRAKGVPLRTFDDALQLRSYVTNERLDASTKVDEKQYFSLKYLFENLVKSTFGMMDMIAREMNNPFIKTDEVDLNHLLENSTLMQKKMNSILGKIQNICVMYESPTAELLSVVDVGITVIKGILDDNLFENGLDSINHLDLREWLAKHGANAKNFTVCFCKIPI